MTILDRCICGHSFPSNKLSPDRPNPIALHERNCEGPHWVEQACDLHGLDCPWNDPVTRKELGGWTSKDRTCQPLYRLEAGMARRQQRGEAHAEHWWVYVAPREKTDSRPPRTAPRLPIMRRTDPHRT